MRQLSVSPLVQILKYWTRAKRTLASPRSKLRLKLVAMLLITTLIGMVLSSLLVLSFHRQQFFDQARSHASHIGVVIEASLFHSMPNPDMTMLEDMINAEASQAGLEYIRILDKEGAIWVSSNSTELGRSFQLNESPCRDCHPNEPNTAQSVSTVNSQIIGEDLVTVILVENQPTCHGCHSRSIRHLGILMVATPVAGLQTELAESSGWLLFSSLISFLLLIGLLTPALEKFVTRPVINIAKGAAEISAGNLDYVCRVKSNDELGELATTFDTMRLRLKTMLEEKERQNHELQMLNDIARITSEQLEPQQILNLTIKTVVKSLKVEAGAIRVLGQDHPHFSLHACHGIPECHPNTCDLRAINIVLAKRPSANNSHNGAPNSTEESIFKVKTDAQGRSYVGIPLETKGMLIGGLTLITYPGQSVTEEGTRTLKAMGQQIGLAVLNAIHFQQARYQATLEERDRLAREMHDSLAQALGYLKMKTTVTDELLSGGQIDQAQVNLREVKELATETYFDVRETIFGLRNASSTSSQFIPGLEEYLGKYCLHYGVQVDVTAEENCHPTFPPDVSLQLIRIIQEALTNVRKHAQANKASIHFTREAHHWRISIEDHGTGFDSRVTQSEGCRFLGLHIMRERAEGISAEFQVDSQPGIGTCVTIRIPFGSEV